MSRYVFDIETDGLLMECTRMWILHVRNIATGEHQQWLEGDMGWVEVMSNARELKGHNIVGYDLVVLKKLFNWTPNPNCKITDTLIMSQVLNYRRFGNDGHSLKRWGENLKFPKQEHEDWTRLSPEMIEYCEQDVRLNAKVYDVLSKEYHALKAKAPLLGVYLDAEHAVAKWCAEASLHGWPFDMEKALILEKRLEASMNLAYDALSSKLGTKTVPTDMVKGIVETKRPRWTKAGFYDAFTARYFGIDPCSGYEGEERMIQGEYSRVEFVPLSLDSVADVKVFLYRNGWTPTEWNFRLNPLTGKKEKSSPKITEDSLEFLGGDGKLYADFLTSKARLSILKTWIKNTDSNGLLHGDCMVIGTPSMRARHSIIVNVPSADAAWGKEMRELFACKAGWKLVGCDSSGNQARGLAHYLNDAKFIDTLLNGDIHQYNADILTKVVNDIMSEAIKKGKFPDDFVVKRSQAKRILYAFLFGAAGAKLWSYIFGIMDVKLGNKLKAGFLKAVPGFENLLEKLAKIYGATSKYGDGYIPSLIGTRIYVDSMHKLLVYLLQATEKATCSAAVMLTMKQLEAEGIPYVPLIFMHDEEDFMVPEEYAERAAEIGKLAFKEGPKLFGIEIMDGDAKIGNNWYEIH